MRKQVNCTAQPTPRNLVVQPSLLPTLLRTSTKESEPMFLTNLPRQFRPAKTCSLATTHVNDSESKPPRINLHDRVRDEKGRCRFNWNRRFKLNHLQSVRRTYPACWGSHSVHRFVMACPSHRAHVQLKVVHGFARNCRSTPGALGSSLASSSPTHHAERTAPCIPTTID